MLWASLWEVAMVWGTIAMWGLGHNMPHQQHECYQIKLVKMATSTQCAVQVLGVCGITSVTPWQMMRCPPASSMGVDSAGLAPWPL